jgi:hypothetical protein
MGDDFSALRAQLVRILDWEEAHVGFDKAVGGIPPDKRNIRPEGLEHSAWEQLEHLRLAQADILDFCVNATYEHVLAWPADYWPTQPADEAAWNASVAKFRRDREEMKNLARETKDLFAPVPTGKPNQTYLRAILLLADHNAYHVGRTAHKVIYRRPGDQETMR